MESAGYQRANERSPQPAAMSLPGSWRSRQNLAEIWRSAPETALFRDARAKPTLRSQAQPVKSVRTSRCCRINQGHGYSVSDHTYEGEPFRQIRRVLHVVIYASCGVEAELKLAAGRHRGRKDHEAHEVSLNDGVCSHNHDQRIRGARRALCPAVKNRSRISGSRP
jgi:hypothetical protein